MDINLTTKWNADAKLYFIYDEYNKSSTIKKCPVCKGNKTQWASYGKFVKINMPCHRCDGRGICKIEEHNVSYKVIGPLRVDCIKILTPEEYLYEFSTIQDVYLVEETMIFKTEKEANKQLNILGENNGFKI